MNIMLRGRVLNDIGFPLDGATVSLFGNTTILGSDPRATTANQEAVSWTRSARGLTGTLRGIWLGLIAPTTGGITWEEFRTQVVHVNPSLESSRGRFEPDRLYLLPENRHADKDKIVWDRTITGFGGDRWTCWQRYVQGKVVGLSWREFRREVLERNTDLAADGGMFQAEKAYLLPHNIGRDEYVRVEYTGRTGRFVFGDLAPGTYRLEVHVEGYEPWTQTIVVDGELKLAVHLKHLKVVPAKGLPVSPLGIPLVQVRGSEFVLENRAFRFIGVNLRGLVHYGTDKFPYANARQQLQKASDMGARVARVFLPVDNVNWRATNHIEDRLEALLQMIEKDFRHMYLIVCLTNLYNDTHFKVFGDDEGDHEDRCYSVAWNNKKLLGRKWFTQRYDENYLKFVQKVVPQFSQRASIMAWEPGNELKLDHQPTEFVNFMLKVAGELQRLAPNQLVTTGMISTQHAYMDPDDPNRRAERLRLLSSPFFDFITVHSYNGVNEHKEESDAQLALSLNPPKPIIVEEAGFVSGPEALKEAARDPKFHIPACAAGGRRRDCVEKDMDKWFNHLQARGYMQWGFMEGFDNNDGDGLSGMDWVIHGKEDWDELFDLYQKRSALLASQAGPVVGPMKPDGGGHGKPILAMNPIKIQPGQQATVIAADGVKVRRSPGRINKLAGDVLTALPAGTRLTILDGPKPMDGLTWWAVSCVTAGQTALVWVAQADGDGTPLIAV